MTEMTMAVMILIKGFMPFRASKTSGFLISGTSEINVLSLSVSDIEAI